MSSRALPYTSFDAPMGSSNTANAPGAMTSSLNSFFTATAKSAAVMLSSTNCLAIARRYMATSMRFFASSARSSCGLNFSSARFIPSSSRDVTSTLTTPASRTMTSTSCAHTGLVRRWRVHNGASQHTKSTTLTFFCSARGISSSASMMMMILLAVCCASCCSGFSKHHSNTASTSVAWVASLEML